MASIDRKEIYLEGKKFFYIIDYGKMTYKMVYGFDLLRDPKFRNQVTYELTVWFFECFPKAKKVAEYQGNLTDKKLKELLPEYYI